MRLKFTWPLMASPTRRENFYVGGWHPRESLAVDWSEPPPAVRPVVVAGENWFLMSNTSPLHPNGPGLVHSARDRPGAGAGAAAFNGYLLSPPIHSFSPSREILGFWLGAPRSEYNGVFSAARIDDSGKHLDLVTDLFGVGPLYYRSLGDLVLFGTNPRFLAADDDKPDYMARRCYVQAQFIAADRALSESIRRVPARHILSFRPNRFESRRWFDYEHLPRGTGAIDDRAVADVEEAFQAAMTRCLELKGGSIFLALSSGNDSRRILSSLVHRGVSFTSGTVRAFQQKYRDLDARFASLMAKEIGFAHTVLEFLGPEEFVRDDHERRILLDSESDLHSWAIRLMESIPGGPSFFFDGLAGDVLGNADLLIPGLLYDAPDLDRRRYLRYCIGKDYDEVLRGGAWPTAGDVRDELDSYIGALPSGVYRVTIAYLLLRTRRTISPWSTQMIPMGHVVVCPYLDLDYIRTVLSYRAVEKYRSSFQVACLKAYWPRFSCYPGSKNIPADMPPGSPRLMNERELASFRQLQKELVETGGISAMTRLLTKRARAQFWLARNSDRMGMKYLWDFRRLMELTCRDFEKVSCWSVAAGPTPPPA
jgi:hypothetical protein